MKKTTLLLFLCLHTLTGYTQVITIQGKIIDSLTQKGIPYVNIGFPKLSIGTSANEEGAFILKIAAKHLTDTLVFSSMGYHTYRVLLKDINKGERETTVLLKSNEIKLSEFVVKSIDAQKIILPAVAQFGSLSALH